jgi:hypothetical protein
MWIALVAMKTCRRERRAPASASTAASTSSSFARASAATVARSATSATLEVAGRGDREARLDHVDAEPLELLGDLRLLVRLQRDAGRLLAVPKRGVEDRDPACAQLAYLLCATRAHYCCGSVDVCAGRRVVRELPLAGENDDDRKEAELGRAREEPFGRHCLTSVARRGGGVNRVLHSAAPLLVDGSRPGRFTF